MAERYRKPSWSAALVAVAQAVLATESTAGQQVVDRGTLIVTRGRDIVAREDFTISAFPDKLTLVTESSYPPRRTRVTLSSQVELGLDSLPQTAVVTASTGGSRWVSAQFGSRRLTIRTRTDRGESVREQASPGRALIVVDSLFAPFAILPGVTAGPLRLVRPKTGNHSNTELRDVGVDGVTLAGVTRQLRHLVLQGADHEIHLWYDDGGRIMRVQDRTAGLVAERELAAR